MYQTNCFKPLQLLYCSYCCEGLHPYCLEDGEGPESDDEERNWICRRCAVCHVCGSPGVDTLMRCSDCRHYYHIECLGPTSHSTCHPNPSQPWVSVDLFFEKQLMKIYGSLQSGINSIFLELSSATLPCRLPYILYFFHSSFQNFCFIYPRQ